MNAAPENETHAEPSPKPTWLEEIGGVAKGVCLWWLEAAIPLGAVIALGWVVYLLSFGANGYVAKSEGDLERPRSVAAENAEAGAEFFGLKATGKRFIFIVDASMSMRGEKFEAAKRELRASIEKLTKDQSFNVAFFNTGAFWMFRDEAGAAQLVQATDENIRTLSHLLDSVQLGYNTEPGEAVTAAVRIAPDAVYLLSDGKFTDHGFTHRWLKGNNIVDPRAREKRPKVTIHTLAFHNHDGAESLKSIAAANGGTYRFVPSPAELSKKK